MDMQKIGKTIAALRRNKGFTQEALAQRLGITPQAVSKWETGLGLPEASLLVELAGLFGVPLDDILGTESPKEPMEGFIRRSRSIPERKLLHSI
ncbi:MAG: helix-turn-helix domain-containing protein, partial [Oscillospiraceae bacterium]|nr:helix-turn-helix domain-containing protein [Oscillospiraceae bacterium]